jgi:hypothetical protein
MQIYTDAKKWLQNQERYTGIKEIHNLRSHSEIENVNPRAERLI